jgi:hypothetical protein
VTQRRVRLDRPASGDIARARRAAGAADVLIRAPVRLVMRVAASAAILKILVKYVSKEVQVERGGEAG